MLEVLVALAIAGLALVVLFRGGGEGLSAVDTASRAEAAVERARSHLAALGRDVALLRGETEGDDGGGYRWRARVAPVASRPPTAAAASGGALTLFDVEVGVSWKVRGRERQVVLRTQRLATVGGP